MDTEEVEMPVMTLSAMRANIAEVPPTPKCALPLLSSSFNHYALVLKFVSFFMSVGVDRAKAEIYAAKLVEKSVSLSVL